MKKLVTILLCSSITFSLFNGCSKKEQINSKEKKVIVFHAGSLSVPLLMLKKAYVKNNPNVKIILEAAGSRACARKITDLNKPCDLMVSADYKVIENLLIPKYADWYINFATNQLCVVYNEKSKYSSQINKDNWYKILMKKNVICGASNPNDDPCGYRTVIMLKLAGLYYKTPKLFDTIYSKEKLLIRPKETDLISLLQANAIDYMFIYNSVAIQHKLKYITLPDNINLGNPKFAGFYKKANVKISGKTPGSSIIQKGAPIIYGVTIPKNAPNKKTATDFLKFMLSEQGLSIIKESGQKPIVPARTDTYNQLPAELKKFAKE